MNNYGLDELLATLLADSGAALGTGGAWSAESLAALLRSAMPTPELEAAVERRRPTPAKGDGSFAEDLGKTFLSGFGVASLFSSLFDWGGGGDDMPASLPKYQAPASLQLDLGYLHSSGSYRLTDRDANDGLRTIGGSQAAPQNITVNIQALDSKSVLDRSGDIAKAVREAILDSHPLGDVIAEL